MALTKDAVEDWSRLCRNSPATSFFQFPRWAQSLAEAYPSFTVDLLEDRRDGGLAGILPLIRVRKLGLRQMLSLPFGTYGGPILALGAPKETAPALAARLSAELRDPRVMRFELTAFHPTPAVEDALNGAFAGCRASASTHLIDLRDGFDTLWTKRYDKEVRTCVRRAEREGVTVSRERGSQAESVLAVLHGAQAQDWPGYRPHSNEAVAAICKALGDSAAIWVARKEGAPLVAVLALYHRGEEAIPWISGMEPEARRLRATHLIYDRMLRDACERGFQSWNFGASAGNPGIEAFKVSLGAVPAPVHRYFREAGWRRALRGTPGS